VEAQPETHPMKTLIRKFVVLAGVVTGLSAVSAALVAAPAAGHWAGTLKMENGDLGIVVDLARNPAGVWIGSMSFPGTTTVDAPIGDIAIDDKSVRFTARVPALATFEGNLASDAATLAGSASNADGTTSFELKRQSEANVKLPAPSSPLPKEFAGQWLSISESEGKTKHVGLRLSPSPDGIAQATLIAIDHGHMEIPITTVTIEGKRLRFESRAISGSFEGTLGANGEIAGEWSEKTKRVPLIFKPAPAEMTKS
jgi:hypothetical protein